MTTFEEFRSLLKKEKQQQNEKVTNGSFHHPSVDSCYGPEDRRGRYRRPFFSLLRITMLDVPLCLIFVTFCVTYLVRHVHSTYYIPLMERTKRTDDQLLDEYTYYSRQCTAYDITTSIVRDLLIQSSGEKDTDVVVNEAVSQMLLHGGVVIPNILRPETVKRLRAYVKDKNANIPEEEQYPVSQGYHRISYGIDASEHPTISSAIREIIGSNNSIIKPFLQSLLGDEDPASAEITAITAWAGAPPQAWHMDTKIDGNAVKYARTYSHSYSLFVPLQDTTASMGATDICPGSHMCSNDLDVICESTKMGLHLVSSALNKNSSTNDTSYFPAGYGALLNQHVWHRGGAHTDKSGEDRIVFIMSFLSRPKFIYGSDQRQLSRGTYFHQKWNMWGHTIQDLLDPATRMRKPWSILRCLSLWNASPSGHWGYDLITATFMRFQNGQLEDDDFESRFVPRLNRLRFPHFLRGSYQDDASQDIVWSTFIAESIEKTFNFMQQLTIFSHIISLIFIFILSNILSYSNSSKLANSCKTYGIRPRLIMFHHFLRRLCVTHSILVMVLLFVLFRVRKSIWGTSIRSGMALMRPFPTASTKQDNTMVSTGLSTLPTRLDVLIGTRYDAPFLGSYNQWLRYHPGNLKLKQAIKINKLRILANQQQKSMSSVVHTVREIIHDMLDTKGGSRFLQQDYRTGNWRIMSDIETFEAVLEEVLASTSRLLSDLRNVINGKIADYRFGPNRHTILSQRFVQSNLWQLKRQLFQIDSFTKAAQKQGVLKKHPTNSVHAVAVMDLAHNSSSYNWNKKFVLKPFKLILRHSDTIAPITDSLDPPHTYSNRTKVRLSNPQPTAKTRKFDVGSLVWWYFDDEEQWYPGTVISAATGKNNSKPNGSINQQRRGKKEYFYTVALDDGFTVANIPEHALAEYNSVTEGDVVEGCFHVVTDRDGTEHSVLDDCYPGRILQVMPGGHITILYDDGELEWIVPPNRYYIPPYLYQRQSQ